MTATAMYKSGYSLHEIVQVTRHKNIENLKCYLEKLTFFFFLENNNLLLLRTVNIVITCFTIYGLTLTFLLTV